MSTDMGDRADARAEVRAGVLGAAALGLDLANDAILATVRDVHEVLHRRDGTGYTTALKILQIMHDKGLVVRDESQRAHVYRAVVSKERTQKKFLSDMLQRVFDGSPSRLVLQALGDHKASREELREIRALLNRLDKEAGK